MKKNIASGFTLIELMIVVAIVAILASIAYPAYLDSVRKGRRAEGRAALADLLQQEERYMTQNNTYFAFATDNAGVTTPATAPFKTYSGDNLATAAYYLSAVACPSATIGECVRVEAAPRISDPDAGTLRILSSGTKDCSSGNTSVCWK